MSLEVALIKRTQLGEHTHCVALMEAYAGAASLWERFCLASYVSIGPPIARLFGADVSAMWTGADSVIADLFTVSRLSPREIVRRLRRYITLKLEQRHHLPFDEACREIYEQDFYPLVTHITFAVQPSALARLKFIREAVATMTPERMEVADLGCGSGVILSDVLKMRPRWKGHGLDISPAAIRYSERLATHKGVGSRADFRTGNIARLPYKEESLDLVIASEVIEHLPNPLAVIEGIARVLRPAGRLLLTLPMESRTAAHINSPGHPDDLRALCEEAGFTVQRIETHWHFGFGDDRRHIFAVCEKGRSKKVKERES